MSLRDDVLAALQADAKLNMLIPGGIYADEITRQETPDAFDANQEIKPCASIRHETETPLGPYATSSRVFVIINFYADDDVSLDGARERVFTLLHRQKVGTNVWIVEHTDDVLDQVDNGLGCGMAVSRYAATRLR